MTRNGVANPSAALVNVDQAPTDNAFRSNFHAAGKIEGRAVAAD